jgi:hypothetical protein
MSMSRDPGPSLVSSEPRAPFTLTVDHWLVIGPLLAAVFIAAALVFMG